MKPLNLWSIHVEVDLTGILDLGDQGALEPALMNVSGEPKELEVVVLVDDLLHQLALRRRQRAGEVRQRLALPLVALGGDVVFEHLAGPAILDCLRRIPEPNLAVFELGEQGDVVGLMPMSA